MNVTITRGFATMDNERDSTSAYVELEGDIDAATSPHLETQLLSLLHDGIRRVTVNCAGVTFLSSAGLSTLISVHQKCDGIRLERGNRLVDRLIELTGLQMLYGEGKPNPSAHLSD